MNCVFCKKEIFHFICKQDRTVEFGFDECGKQSIEIVRKYLYTSYCCPFCKKELTQNRESAIFLMRKGLDGERK